MNENKEYKQYFIGLLSGTSIDSIDVAITEINSHDFKLIATHSHEIPKELKQTLQDIIINQATNLKTFGETNRQLGTVFAEAIMSILKKSSVCAEEIIAIGFHGQTIYHHPVLPYNFSLQIGDPNTIVETTGIPVITDFRQRDMVNFGQGAPLAPLFHQKYFTDNLISRAIVNIGGITNITLLGNNTSNRLSSADLGPGNTLLDQWYLKHNNKYHYDHNGLWAKSGTFDPELLSLLLDDPYFMQPWPKSTGREYFNLAWLNNYLNKNNQTQISQISPENIQRTLLELTALLISKTIESHNNKNHQKITEIYLCGGGVHNQLLFDRITELLFPLNVQTTEALGVPPDSVEAALFAWLAYNTWNQQKLDLQAITGNIKSRTILGCIYY
ncbi:MAG: anhydro-N-acetylmuramic acid kinase [Gammaproteobacteria bacterium]|nr:anhydro-N-acetylmuramic acid kinase [Gammaproteobacteria bacterium]